MKKTKYLIYSLVVGIIILGAYSSVTSNNFADEEWPRSSPGIDSKL